MTLIMTLAFVNLEIIVHPFLWEHTFSIIVIIFLLFSSAMISASEIAFFSLTHQQIEEIENSNSSNRQRILHQIDNPKKLLAGILIGNNFVNVGVVILSTSLINTWFTFGEHSIIAFVIQVLLITAFLLLIGEITPKIYARQNALKIVNIMVKPLMFLQFIFKPLVVVLVTSTNFIDKRMQKTKVQLSMSELSEAVDITVGDEELLSKNEELKILKGIATFGETEVKEIMKARVDVAALDIDISFQDVLTFIREWGYSRLPVYDEHFDKVVGVLHIKDLLGAIDKDEFNWHEKIRPAFFVPEYKKINDLLQEFKEKKIHLAIVVDEYGGTSGIVTLEDVLEEIVGEISDEFDTENKDFVFNKVDENHWVFEAKTSIIDLCKIIDVDYEYFDKVKGESDSIGGLLLELKGDFPKLKEIIEYENFQFIVLKLDQRRMKRISVKRINTES